MHVVVTCKNEDDRIKTEEASVFTKFLPLLVYGDFSRHSRVANSAVLGPILPNFELVRDIMKNEDDRIKTEEASVFTKFLPLLVYGDFSRHARVANSAVLGPILPNFKLARDIMNVLVICKYEEDLIKNESARVFTKFSR